MKVIGTGRPIRIYLTRAEFEELKAKSAEGQAPRTPPLPIAVPMGVPVFVDDRLSEGVVLCESAGWWWPEFDHGVGIGE